MDPGEQNFRIRMARSIRLIASTYRLPGSRRRIELIVDKINAHPFGETEQPAVAKRIAAISRFLDSNEIGAARHELVSLGTFLTEKR